MFFLKALEAASLNGVSSHTVPEKNSLHSLERRNQLRWHITGLFRLPIAVVEEPIFPII